MSLYVSSIKQYTLNVDNNHDHSIHDDAINYDQQDCLDEFQFAVEEQSNPADLEFVQLYLQGLIFQNSCVHAFDMFSGTEISLFARAVKTL